MVFSNQIKENNMAATKYGQYIKSLPSFQDYGLGDYRQGIKMDCDFLELDVHVEFGAYWTAGRMGGENYGPHVHDFIEVMIWMGADTSDLGYLGAEVELFMGEEMEKHMIATSTAVFIPKGFQHFPATITRMESRFLFMVISCAREYKATPVHSDKTLETIPIAGW